MEAIRQLNFFHHQPVSPTEASRNQESPRRTTLMETAHATHKIVLENWKPLTTAFIAYFIGLGAFTRLKGKELIAASAACAAFTVAKSESIGWIATLPVIYGIARTLFNLAPTSNATAAGMPSRSERTPEQEPSQEAQSGRGEDHPIAVDPRTFQEALNDAGHTLEVGVTAPTVVAAPEDGLGALRAASPASSPRDELFVALDSPASTERRADVVSPLVKRTGAPQELPATDRPLTSSTPPFAGSVVVAQAASPLTTRVVELIPTPVTQGAAQQSEREALGNNGLDMDSADLASSFAASSVAGDEVLELPEELDLAPTLAELEEIAELTEIETAEAAAKLQKAMAEKQIAFRQFSHFQELAAHRMLGLKLSLFSKL